MKVAFIGLGIMGSRMAGHLLKAGVDLIVYNRSIEPVRELEKEGAVSAPSASQAVENADIVFSMLSNPQVVEEIMMGEVLDHMKPNSLWVDCSTVNPSFSLAAFETAKTAGVRFLDAPVAGSKNQAENKEIVFFVGGSQDDIKDVEPLLNHMGSKVLHIGEAGKGSSFKMLVNLMLGLNMAAFSETILLGQSMGIDKEFLLNVIPNLPVVAPFTKLKAENIRNSDWEVQFPLELMHKDLHLASLTAYENEMTLYMGNLVKELYAGAVKDGMGRLDMSAIHKHLES